MAIKSAPIRLYDPVKLDNVNAETKKLWGKYQIDMELRELSPKTIAGYLNDLQGWWIYILDYQDNKSILEINEDDITEFLYWCKKQGNNSRRIKRRMSSIAAFYKFLRKKRYISENPMEFIDRPKKDTDVVTQTFLSSEQVALMRKCLNENVANSKTDHAIHMALMLRLYAFFSLSTMARVNAVSKIRWDQVDWDNRLVDDVVEKEGYIVTLYFSTEVFGYLKELKAFREDHGIDDDGWVFCIPGRGAKSAVSTCALNDWCKKIGNMIGVPTLHPHDFRHSGSQLMKLAGAPIEEISALLHHQGLDVTKKHYLREDKKKLQESRDKYGV